MAAEPQPASIRSMPLRLTCLESTQPSQTTASAIGIAMTLRKTSIQAPGLGSILDQPGKMQSRSHGSAMPRPSERKTAIASTAGCVTA